MEVEAEQDFQRLFAVKGKAQWGPNSLPGRDCGGLAAPQGSLTLKSIEQVLQTEHLKK